MMLKTFNNGGGAAACCFRRGGLWECKGGKLERQNAMKELKAVKDHLNSIIQRVENVENFAATEGAIVSAKQLWPLLFSNPYNFLLQAQGINVWFVDETVQWSIYFSCPFCRVPQPDHGEESRQMHWTSIASCASWRSGHRFVTLRSQLFRSELAIQLYEEWCGYIPPVHGHYDNSESRK